MEYYFDRDDRLDRQKYARFLKTLLLNCDKYRREDSDGAYVIALDSPWGTGKTRFVKMLMSYLEERSPRIVDGVIDQSFKRIPGRDRLFNVVYYNSWDTDYWNDALEPLICSIMDSRVLEVEGAEAENAKIRDTILKILKGVGIALTKLALGEAAGSVFQGVLDEVNGITDPLTNYKARMDLYEDFKMSLGSVIKRTNKKLVIIIDELDRCRPTFAIQTLELAKHLFDVPNVIFIFALDIKQLGYSVETVYGQRMDASGYLCRFFDYISMIPLPDIKRFFSYELSEINYFQKTKNKPKNSDLFSDFLLEYYEEFELSLRDITTLFQSFKICERSYLDIYSSLTAHELYFVLLLIKYKDNSLYRLITSGRILGENFEVIEKQIQRRLLRFEKWAARLTWIASNKSIANGWYDVHEDQETPIGYQIRITKVSLDSARTLGLKKLVIYYEYHDSDGQVHRNKSDVGETVDLSGVLFYEDIEKWEQIKNLTLAQYYHRQLEMFDFVLPADEAKVEG